jgi:Tol biopolymer transport system component
VWHPDGKRVSVGALDCDPGPTFWTVPLDGGAVVKSETIREAADQMADAGNKALALPAFGRFAWAPSGKAVYFEHKSGGAINLWRMTIDPETLQVTGVERLTTGAGRDAEFALSPDGTKLAFTAKVQRTCVWVFPFDASAGRILAAGHAVSSPGMAACEATLSPDGSKLAFCVERAGRWELREKSVPNGHEAPVIAGDYFRTHPVWSPDARRLAYMCTDPKTWRGRICVWSVESREEETVAVPGLASEKVCPFDWSPDGKSLLVCGSASTDEPGMGIWLLSIAGAPDVEAAVRKIAYDPACSLYQAHFSPDGRWIVFEGTKNAPSSPESNLYVIPASGGPWTRITDGKDWADKPRWSPDGKVIYFLSGRSAFFDVWGIRFNPVEGRALGGPFRVTSFDSPGLSVSEPISLAGLSVTHHRLAVTLTEASGSIWILDNVDR